VSDPTGGGGRRVAKLEPTALDNERRELYAAITSGPRAGGPLPLTDARGGLEGPFNGFLLQPRLGSALQALGTAVRFGTSLAPRCREIAILVVAAHRRSDFERYAHEAIGRRAGLTDEELAAVRGGSYANFEGIEAVVARTADALAGRADLDDAEYAGAVEALGESGVFELLTLVGYYSALALQLRVLRVPLPDGAA
jgi:4-carboxymuconolactone decarboxylase